jgi:hypothetical protein
MTAPDLFSNQPPPPPKQRKLPPEGSHLCAVDGCGLFGCFGSGGSLRQGRAYTWLCREHWAQTKVQAP